MTARRLSALIVIAACAAVPAVAQAALYDVPRVLRSDLRRVAPRTEVPIRLPARIALDFGRSVYGDGTGTAGRYEFVIDATAQCGANVCFLAQFTGEKGGELAFRRRVRLARGIVGRYKPLTCGGSCSPPTIEWKQRGNLYRIQAKIGVSGRTAQREAMVRAANSAIRSRPR